MIENIEIAGITYKFDRLDTARQLPPIIRREGRHQTTIAFALPHIYRNEEGLEISIIPEVKESMRRIK